MNSNCIDKIFQRIMQDLQDFETSDHERLFQYVNHLIQARTPPQSMVDKLYIFLWEKTQPFVDWLFATIIEENNNMSPSTVQPQSIPSPMEISEDHLPEPLEINIKSEESVMKSNSIEKQQFPPTNINESFPVQVPSDISSFSFSADYNSNNNKRISVFKRLNMKNSSVKSLIQKKEKIKNKVNIKNFKAFLTELNPKPILEEKEIMASDNFQLKDYIQAASIVIQYRDLVSFTDMQVVQVISMLFQKYCYNSLLFSNPAFPGKRNIHTNC